MNGGESVCYCLVGPILQQLHHISSLGLLPSYIEVFVSSDFK